MSDQVTPVVASPEASVLMGGLSPVRAGLTSKYLPPPGGWAGRRERGSGARWLLRAGGADRALPDAGQAAGRAPGRGPAHPGAGVAGHALDAGPRPPARGRV